MVLPKTLLIAGDHMVDIYLGGEWKGKHLQLNETERRWGGASNTTMNAISLARNSDLIVSPSQIVPTSGLLENLYFPEEQDYVKFTPHTPKEQRLFYSNAQRAIDCAPSAPWALIVSDYNKGNVSKLGAAPAWDKDPEFILIDSKYRSIHPGFLENDIIKIWRCTGDEYDEDYATNFDYVIKTDGPLPIWILEDGEPAVVIPVKYSHCVNDCGAGDTFTAALGVYLALCGVCMQTLIRGCEEAVLACAEVITDPHTSITTRTIELK